MTKEEMIELLNSDLKNEWMHMSFYLHHASRVVGLYCHEYKEFFLKEAASEMNHVNEFSDVIVGLGGVPTTEINSFPKITDAYQIIEHALKMEENVVENYVNRIKDAEKLGGVDGKWLEIFLEKQIEHSRVDVDHFRQILKGIWLIFFKFLKFIGNMENAMRYNIVHSLPVARFFYKGNHSHPVRRTVLVTQQDSESITGYELREGSKTRIAKYSPIKTYIREKIAKTSNLRNDNPLRNAPNPKSTLVRKPLIDLIESGI